MYWEGQMENLLSVKETAARLKCSTALVYKWTCARTGPRFVKVGSRVAFRPEDLEAWVSERTVEPVSGGK
jgi:excisionase family DNA binding protein